MARARNIKPSIMDNEELADLEPLTRLLFVYLWMLADREGRLENRPKRIAAQALPYDRAVDVGAMLDELEQAGFITRYTAAGKDCIQIAAFAKHQTPHGTEKDSDLPNEEGFFSVHLRGKNGYATGEVQLVNRGLTVKPQVENTLIPDSGFLIPDSGYSPAADAASPAPVSKTKKPIPDDFGISERVREWATKKGYGQLEEHLEAFIRKCRANGYKKLSWDDTFMEAIREDWAKLRGRGQNGAAPAGEHKTVPTNPKDIYKPAPQMTPEQLEANRLNAAKALEAIKTKGLSGLKEMH
jgi:hypothetical protein